MSTIFKQVKNNAKSFVANNALNNTNATSVVAVRANTGSKFSPTGNPYFVTAWNSNAYNDPGDDPHQRIGLCTERDTDELTITWGQLGTSITAIKGQPMIAMLVEDQHLIDIHTAINAAEAAILTKATASALAAVAYSGAYGDLSGRPTIPVIQDATNTVKGVLKLAKDLGGTADNPTVSSRESTFTIGTIIGQAADYICQGTHDGATIAQAVAALPAVGGKLKFRNGIYNFADYTDRIFMNQKNVEFEGETFGGVIFKATGVLHPNGATGGTDAVGRYGMLVVGYSQTSMIDHIAIRNIVFDVNNQQRTAALTLDGGTGMTGLIGLQNVQVENIKIMNSRPTGTSPKTIAGLQMISGATQSFGTTKGYLDHITFKNVEVTGQGDQAWYMLGGNFTNIHWDELWIHDNDQTGVYYYDSQNAAITSSDWTFTRSRFELNGQKPIATTGDIFFGYQHGVNNFQVDASCYFGTTGNTIQPHFGIMLYWGANNSIKNSIFDRGYQAINLATSYAGHYNTVFPTNRLFIQGNIFYQNYQIFDPDSTVFAMVKDNFFIETQTQAVLKSYSRHFPTVYDGNIIYDCHTATTGTEDPSTLTAIEIGQDGFDVRNNYIIDDRLLVNPISGDNLSLSSVAGGTMSARTYYARYTWFNDTGETLGSTEQTLSIPANSLFQSNVGFLPPSGAKGLNVYVGASAGSEKLQATITNLLGMTGGGSSWVWTEPTTGLTTTGASVPTTNTTHAKTLYGIYELSNAGDVTHSNVYQDNHYIGIPTEEFLNNTYTRIRSGNTTEKNGTISFLPTEGAMQFVSDVQVLDPVNPKNPVTKQYFDNAFAANNVVHTAVRAATTTALPAYTYDNGTAGVGATITLTNVNQGWNYFGIDGVTSLVVGDRILIKNETTQVNNGVYQITTLGGGGVHGVATRVSDLNTGTQLPGATIPVETGTVNLAQFFMVASNGPFTVGTTNIVFTRVGSSAVIAPVLAPAKYATVAALPAYTYSNGTAGVGATISVTNVNTTLNIDGVTKTSTIPLAVGDRILVKNEPNAAYNGVYTVTATGGGGVHATLTRVTDFDEATEIAGVSVFVDSGPQNGGNVFSVKGAGPYTMGTTAIVFSPGVRKTAADPADWGALYDVTALATITVGASSTDLNTTNSYFVPSDVGKVIVVNGAGASGANLITTIGAYISPTEITLAAAATTAVSNVAGEYGTDNTPFYQAAGDSLDPVGGILKSVTHPLPGYVGAVTISSAVTVLGDGITNVAVKLKPGTNSWMFTTRDTIANTTSYPHDHQIQNLYADLNNTNNPTQAGLFLTTKNRNPVIQGSKWINYNNRAVYMVGSGGNIVQPRLANNQSDYGDRTNGTSIFLDYGVYDGLLRELDLGRGYNGLVISSGGNGNFTLDKVLTWGNANLGFQNYNSHNNLVSNSTFDQNQKHGVEVNGSNNVTFVNVKPSNNSFADPSNLFGYGTNISTPNVYSGIRVCSGSRNIRIDSPTFTNDIRTASANNPGGQAYGVQVEDGSQVFITNPIYTNMLSGHVNVISGTVNYYTVPNNMPSVPTVTPSTTGGTLAAGLKTYRITGIDVRGGETEMSAEASTTTTGSTGSVALSWTALPGMVSYRIYRGTAYGGESNYIASNTNSVTDTNQTGTTATPPASSTSFASHIADTGPSWVGGSFTADGGLVSRASFTTGYFVTTASLTLNASHRTVEISNASHVVALPDATTCTGREYSLIDATGTAATINANGSQTIGNTGAATSSYTLAAGNAVTLVSNGTNWRIA